MKTPTDLNNLLSKLMHQAKLDHLGWDADVKNLEIMSDGDLVHLYVYDEVTEFSWLACLSKTIFIELASEGGLLSVDEIDAVRAGIASQISRWADGQSRVVEDENNAAILATLYAGGTKTCRTTGAKNIGHFFIILYRGTGASGGLLRPFASGHTDGAAMDSTVFLTGVAQVIAMDRVNHPEWFN